MTREKTKAVDTTPAAGLKEGGMHMLLGYQLAQVTILTNASFVRVAGDPLELRPVEFTILQLVHENAPVNATKVAKALAVSLPAITLWLDRMEQRGLVERERDRVDRRAQNLRITRKGENLVTSALERLLEADREIMSSLTEGERQMTLELLSKLARVRNR